MNLQINQKVQVSTVVHQSFVEMRILQDMAVRIDRTIQAVKSAAEKELKKK